VIEELEILAFDPATRAKIRAVIEQLVVRGHPLEFLRLTELGTVVYDREAETDAIELEHFTRQL
jgi:hypothetical protein